MTTVVHDIDERGVRGQVPGDHPPVLAGPELFDVQRRRGLGRWQDDLVVLQGSLPDREFEPAPQKITRVAGRGGGQARGQ